MRWFGASPNPSDSCQVPENRESTPVCVVPQDPGVSFPCCHQGASRGHSTQLSLGWVPPNPPESETLPAKLWKRLVLGVPEPAAASQSQLWHPRASCGIPEPAVAQPCSRCRALCATVREGTQELFHALSPFSTV